MKLNKKAQVAMDRIVKKFQTGDLSPIVKVARLQISKDIPAANWSFSNQVIAFAQTDSIDCRGYRQWQKVGRQVQKGSKAAYIIYPKKVKAKETDKDGKPVYICIGFGATAVFPRHTTTVIEGQEDLDINYEPTQLPPLYDVAIKLGIQFFSRNSSPSMVNSFETRKRSNASSRSSSVAINLACLVFVCTT